MGVASKLVCAVEPAAVSVPVPIKVEPASEMSPPFWDVDPPPGVLAVPGDSVCIDELVVSVSLSIVEPASEILPPSPGDEDGPSGVLIGVPGELLTPSDVVEDCSPGVFVGAMVGESSVPSVEEICSPGVFVEVPSVSPLFPELVSVFVSPSPPSPVVVDDPAPGEYGVVSAVAVDEDPSPGVFAGAFEESVPPDISFGVLGAAVEVEELSVVIVLVGRMGEPGVPEVSEPPFEALVKDDP